MISATSFKSNSWLKYFNSDSSCINHVYCLRALDGRLASPLKGKEKVFKRTFIQGKEERKRKQERGGDEGEECFHMTEQAVLSPPLSEGTQRPASRGLREQTEAAKRIYQSDGESQRVNRPS